MSDIDATFAAASKLHAEGKFADAEALYRRILAGTPDHTGALHHLGTIDFQLGRFADAEARLRRASALQPADRAILINLGRILLALARPLDAAGSFRAALALDPFLVPALAGLSDALGAAGRFSEGLT